MSIDVDVAVSLGQESQRTRHALAKDADALTPEDTAELQRQLARLDKRRAEISLDYRSNPDNDYRANLFEAVLDIGTNSAEALKPPPRAQVRGERDRARRRQRSG